MHAKVLGRRRCFADETRDTLLGSWFPRLNHCQRDLLTPLRPPCLPLEQWCCGFESFLRQQTISFKSNLVRGLNTCTDRSRAISMAEAALWASPSFFGGTLRRVAPYKAPWGRNRW